MKIYSLVIKRNKNMFQVLSGIQQLINIGIQSQIKKMLRKLKLSFQNYQLDTVKRA